MNKPGTTGLKQIRLDPEKLMDRESMAHFMEENLELPEWFGGNLDALADVLSEVTRETVFEVEIGTASQFDMEEYPGKVLLVVARAARENPHLHLYLTDSSWPLPAV